MESSLGLVKAQLGPLLSRLRDIYDKNPRLVQTVAFTSLILGPPLRKNYIAYLSLGPGATPYNAFGWAISTVFTAILGREMFSVDAYANNPNKDMWLDPSTFPIRKGDRPVMSWHAIPQRQLTQRNPDPTMHDKISALIQKYAKANQKLVECIRSPHERLHECLSIHPVVETPHDVAKKSWREILHIHDGSDWSMHAVLSPKDCKLVMDNGWGQRHPFSTGMVVPREYLFIYTPRNEEEFEVYETILRASVGFMTASRNVQP